MTELRRPGHEVITGKVVGYGLVEEIPPDWKKVTTTFTSLEELLAYPVDSENGAEFFTRFELPDGSIEAECGVPSQGGVDEVGNTAYRLVCTECGKPHWWKGSATRDFTCAECNSGDGEVPDDIEQFEREY